MTDDDEYRNTPEWQAWARETARRSQAMTDASHSIQGKKLYDQDAPKEEATPDPDGELPDASEQWLGGGYFFPSGGKWSGVVGRNWAWSYYRFTDFDGHHRAKSVNPAPLGSP